MIVDRIDAWIAAGRPSTPEQLAFVRDRIYLPMVEDGLRFLGPRSERKPEIYASSKEQGCERAAFYVLTGTPSEDFPHHQLLKMRLGNFAEADFASEGYMAGAIYDYQVKVRIPVGGVEVNGYVDFVSTEQIPCEVKSMKPEAMDFAMREGGPTDAFGHRTQVLRYIKALDAPYGLYCPVDYQGRRAEYPVERNDGYLDAVDRRVALARAAAQAKEVPPRPEWAVTKGVRDPKRGPCDEVADARCRYCSFLGSCWPEFEKIILSKGPVWRKFHQRAVEG